MKAKQKIPSNTLWLLKDIALFYKDALSSDQEQPNGQSAALYHRAERMAASRDAGARQVGHMWHSHVPVHLRKVPVRPRITRYTNGSDVDGPQDLFITLILL